MIDEIDRRIEQESKCKDLEEEKEKLQLIVDLLTSGEKRSNEAEAGDDMDLKNQNVKLRVEIADEKSKIKELEEQNCRETTKVKELEGQNQNSKESHQKEVQQLKQKISIHCQMLKEMKTNE